MKKVITSIIVMGVSATGYAQETTLTGGLNLTDGNSETLTANAGILHEAEDDARSHALGAEGNYGEVDGETTVEDVKVFGKYTQVLRDPMYGYAAADWITDDVANIDSRLTVGAGVGTLLIDKEEVELGVELGISYVFEELNIDIDEATGDVDVDDSDDYVAFSIGQHYKRTLSETSKVWQSVVYLAEINDVDNSRIEAEIGIEAAIAGNLSLRLVVQDRYENEPPPNTEDNDVRVIGGFSYKL